MRMVKAISLIFVLMFVYRSYAQEKLLDFGKFKVQVIDTKEIQNFKGERGKLSKASRRDTRLIELKLEIVADVAGEFGLYPGMFSTMFVYRGNIQNVPATALGTKYTDSASGENHEYWYNEPDVSIILGVDAGEKFYKYLIVEIPKEVSKFHLQGPMTIQEIDLK